MNADPRPRDIADFYPTVNTFLRGIRDIHHDDLLLEKCFVNVWARDFDANAVASYAFNLPAVAFKTQNDMFRQRALEKIECFSQQTCLDPILVYAHVGHGKTTYLRYLTQVRLRKEEALMVLADKVYFIYLEYTLADPECKMIRADFEDRLELVIARICKEHQITFDYNTLKDIFPADALHYERGKEIHALTAVGFQQHLASRYVNDNVLYLRHIVNWLLHQRKLKICCVLDNVDRHLSQFGSEKPVIALFQTIRACFIQIILPLRIANRGLQYNEYFMALSPIPITLGLPDFGKLMQKRLDHIDAFLTKDLGNPIWAFDNKTYLDSKEVMEKLRAVCDLIDGNLQVKTAMEMLSNYVTREYLDIMINLFSAAPLYRHPLTGERIDYGARLGRGKFHALFIYSLMLRNNKEFTDDDRGIPIVDMFTNNTDQRWKRFARYYVLNHLAECNERVSSVALLTQQLEERYKIAPHCVRQALVALCRKLCIAIDTPTHIEAERIEVALDNPETTLMLSPRGLFHLHLACELEYYEILAYGRLYRRKAAWRSGERTFMTERAENLRLFLEDMAKEEDACIAGSTHPAWAWKVTCLPKLLEEFTNIFGHNKAPEAPSEPAPGADSSAPQG